MSTESDAEHGADARRAAARADRRARSTRSRPRCSPTSRASADRAARAGAAAGGSAAPPRRPSSSSRRSSRPSVGGLVGGVGGAERAPPSRRRRRSRAGLGGGGLRSRHRCRRTRGPATGSAAGPSPPAPRRRAPASRDIITTASATVVVDDVPAAAETIGDAAEAARRLRRVDEHRADRRGDPVDPSTGVAYDDSIRTPTRPTARGSPCACRRTSSPAWCASSSALGEVTASSINRQDVTEQTVDLQARIEAVAGVGRPAHRADVAGRRASPT